MTEPAAATPTPTVTPAVEATGLTVRRDGVVVLDGLDLAVRPGELVAVTGPSLSGKTTLVELLAGWSRPDAGTVSWDGSTTPPPWSHLGVVPQGFALLEELTVLENIDLAGRFDHTDRRDGHHRDSHPDHPDRDEWRDHLLERLGLDHLRHRGAFEVSVGERQRTMVARALAGRPAVVLADEPVAHQDDRHAGVVLDLLRAAATDGAAVVVASRSPLAADRTVELGPPGPPG